MADPIGVTSSLIAIAGLALKIAHQLDQMMKSYCDAPSTFGAFRSNFTNAQNIIIVVTLTLKEHGYEVNESIKGVDFKKQLQAAVSGIEVTLNSVCSGLSDVRRLERAGLWSFRDKVSVVWDEDQLDKWDKILARQVSALNTLMTAHIYWSQMERAAGNGNLASTASYTALEGPEPAEHTKELDFGTDDDQSNIQAEAEGTEIKVAFAITRREGVAQSVMDSIHQRAGCLVEGHPEIKFRILLMGKQGNGKTTLCQRVLGVNLPELSQHNKGSIFGDSTPFDNVQKEQTFPGRNPDLIIHDSGGFENGSDAGTRAVKNFLEEHRPDLVDLSKTVHCIWYVIACTGTKPIQPIDEQFLQNYMDVDDIPVFIVLTKYDVLVKEVAEVTGLTGKNAQKEAYDEFNNRTLTPLRKLVMEAREKHGMKVKICTVGLKAGSDEFMPQFYKAEGLRDFGSVQLVALMKKSLSPKLAPLLAAIQVADPKTKLTEAVQASLKLYWSAIIVKSIPILPYITLGTLATVYILTLKKAQRIWKIETEPNIKISSLEGEATSLIIKSIFDIKTDTDLAFLSAALALEVSGLLAASKMARNLVTIVVGTNALLYDSWKVQHGSGTKEMLPLSLDQMQKVCKDFQGSMRRAQMIREIEAINFTNMYKKREVLSIADRASRASIGEVVPTLKKTERQRREEMGQFEAANPV
ncbi:hypothetical protein V8F06_011186 [Rhypophila decipiens]